MNLSQLIREAAAADRARLRDDIVAMGGEVKVTLASDGLISGLEVLRFPDLNRFADAVCGAGWSASWDAENGWGFHREFG